MKRYGPAFLISILLHAGLLGLAYISWSTAPEPVKVTTVAVEIIADAPSREMAEAPVDELAVTTPEPIPAPEEPQPAPPEPAPKLPVPAPQKPAEKVPDKKTDAAKKAPAPDPKGLKKPQPAKTAPDKKPKAEEDFLNRLSATPAQSPSKKPARPNTQATDGQSQRGNAPSDAGLKTDLDALSKRLGRLWTLNCDIPGSDRIRPDIRFTLSPNGRVIRGPEWANRRADPVWEAGANLAIQAVRKGEPYTNLPDGLYNRSLLITFDAPEVCRGR